MGWKMRHTHFHHSLPSMRDLAEKEKIVDSFQLQEIGFFRLNST